MMLFNTKEGVVIERDGTIVGLTHTCIDDIFTSEDPVELIEAQIDRGNCTDLHKPYQDRLIAPIQHQEVWAAGVTYYRSRDARMEESQDAGGADFYAKVYNADRPELFMKAAPHRVVGPGEGIRIRRDAKWNVPEPELTLAISSHGKIFGYTVGNDMSSRDIEGENPLYLPQAKVYDQCCGLGPGILISADPLPESTAIKLEITRNGEVGFTGETTLAMLKRKPDELVKYLYYDNSFPKGSFLLTGTGIIPGSDFTLQADDVVDITIDSIGTLSNSVIQG